MPEEKSNESIALIEMSKPFSGCRVLAVSSVSSYNGNNTSVQRIKALQELGCDVRVIDSSLPDTSRFGNLHLRIRNQLFQKNVPVTLPDLKQDNSRLISALKETPWDILWLDKCLSIHRSTLQFSRNLRPETKIVGFSPDDMHGRHNQSKQWLEALPVYDCYITTKSYNVAELTKLGCQYAYFMGNGFDPGTFRTVPLSVDDIDRLGADVSFIGTYEKERAGMMYRLAVEGLRVRIWGGGWEQMTHRHQNLKVEGRHLYGIDFAKACGASKINLGFLRKLNRDRQTTRSVEIPACGGFMLAERTEEHLQLFSEGVEAEYFGSFEELLRKCRHYLQSRNDEARQLIANNGRERCATSGYSYAARLSGALNDILGFDFWKSKMVERPK